MAVHGYDDLPNFLDDFRQALVKQDVGIIEFAESDKYVGKRLYPRQRVLLKLIYLEELDGYEEDVLNEWIRSSEEQGEVRIQTDIRKRIELLREAERPHFRLVQLVGGRRSGKGHTTGICIAKKVWDLVQLDDPGAHYGVDADKDIYIPIVAAKEDQAKWHQYSDAQAAISACKPLQKYIKRIREEGTSIYTPSDLRKEAALRARGVDVVRDMAKIRVMPFASSADTVRGAAAIAYCFDEMAFMLQGDSRRSGEEVWTAAIPSLAQFGQDALVFANSSPYTKVGKFFDLYEDAFATACPDCGSEIRSGKCEGCGHVGYDGPPLYEDHFCVQFPSWEMYKDWEKDPERRFKNAIMIYDSVKQEERSDPDKFRVEYRGQFAETIDAYLDPRKVDQIFVGHYQEKILNTNYGGVAGFMYKGHGDPSGTGANFGIAIGHVEYMDEIDPDTGNVLPKVPHVIFDLIDAFYPADFEHKAIDWLVVMDTLVGYINNFRPYEFTFDQFDSRPAIAMLNKEIQKRSISGVRIHEKTATYRKNRMRWDNFKAAVYLGRVHAPNPYGQLNERSLALAREELKFLQDKNGKVVKQDFGPIQTKDMADCIAEVTDALIGHTLNPSLQNLGITRPLAGAERGYRIGGDPFHDFYSGRNKPGAGLMPTRGMKHRQKRGS